MKTIRRKAVTGALVAALTTAALVGASTPASADAWNSCDLRVKLQELSNWDVNKQYNIIVWKSSAYGSAKLRGVVLNDATYRTECKSAAGRTDYYHWAIFKSGEFTRKGDGGYRNWAFSGKWDRKSDTHVVFHPR